MATYSTDTLTGTLKTFVFQWPPFEWPGYEQTILCSDLDPDGALTIRPTENDDRRLWENKGRNVELPDGVFNLLHSILEFSEVLDDLKKTAANMMISVTIQS